MDDEHEHDSDVREQVENVYDETDASLRWVIAGIDGDRVVSDRVTRQEAAEGLA